MSWNTIKPMNITELDALAFFMNRHGYWTKRNGFAVEAWMHMMKPVMIRNWEDAERVTGKSRHN